MDILGNEFLEAVVNTERLPGRVVLGVHLKDTLELELIWLADGLRKRTEGTGGISDNL